MPGRSRRSSAVHLAGLVAIAAATVVIASLPPQATPRAVADPSGSGATGATQCPSSNPPNTLTLVSGDPQTAQLDAPFASPIAVVLANTNGCPITTAVAGTAITFSAPASGPSGVFSTSGANTLTVGTDPSGSASASMFTANATPGTYTVTAASAYGTVSFTLTNTAAGIPATITAIAPASEHASVNGGYPQPLAVRVLDANGNPVVDATVNFMLGSGSSGSAAAGASAGATFAGGGSQVAEQTDSLGIATSPSFSANATIGPFTATATTAHVSEPAVFALENRAGKAATIRLLGAAHMAATVEGRYRRPLRVRVLSPAGAPLAGVTVTFTLGAGTGGASAGAAATFADGSAQASATTGEQGIATSPTVRANGTAGTIAATAMATGIPGSVRITLRNRAGKPATITAGVAATESSEVDTRFGVPLAVTVTDSHGNRVPDVEVTFTAPGSGPGGTFTRSRQRPTTIVVRTDSDGVAVAPPFTANGDPGGYVVTASARGARAAAFALVNEAS
jgi:hypothetical protein